MNWERLARANTHPLRISILEVFGIDGGRTLYAAVTLPNLIVGTVGGGTSLPSQRACLQILKLQGNGTAPALAEVCAALMLAGELSIVGSLCAGDFAKAHHRLSRSTRANPCMGDHHVSSSQPD